MVLQVDRAWEYLLQEKSMNESFMSYAVKVHRLDGGSAQRGIYLRENSNTDKASTFRVNVRYEATKVMRHLIISGPNVAEGRCNVIKFT